MGQYCFTGCHLSSSVVCNAAGVRRRARGRSAHRRPGAWESGGQHCTAGQYGYVPLRRHLIFIITLAASSGKRNVTVWRQSVCLSVGVLTVTHQGAACDAARVHFDPTIRRIVSVVIANVGTFHVM